MDKLDVDFFKELRRNAYVKSIESKISGKIVVGTFGDVDESILYGFNLIPFPIISVDGFIFQYGKLNSFCHAINSTRIYLETGKCPLLFSSEFIVHNNLCPIFIEEIKKSTDKEFISSDNIEEYLKNSNYEFIREKYLEAENDLNILKDKYKLLRKTNIDSKLLSYAKFYIHYEPDLKKRINIYDNLLSDYKYINNKRKPIRALCPHGILDEIDEKNYFVIESMDEPDYAPFGCAFCNKNYRKYEV